MKSTRDQVLEILDQLPEDAPLERVILEMQNRASIRRGFDELRRGEGIGHEELKEQMREWRNSSGRKKPDGA